jgi:hypothetical protein
MNIKITSVRYIRNHILEIDFNDYTTKRFDFSKLVNFKSELGKPLKKIEFFKKVKVISHGRGIMWQNGYDCCADWLRYYAMDESKEWENFSDKISLEERIKFSRKKQVA